MNHCRLITVSEPYESDGTEKVPPVLHGGSAVMAKSCNIKALDVSYVMVSGRNKEK